MSYYNTGRDSQRNRLYNSENLWKFDKECLLTKPEVEMFIKQILHSDFIKTYKTPRIYLERTSEPQTLKNIDLQFTGKQKYCYGGIKTYQIARMDIADWGCKKVVILHELSHFYCTEGPCHGRQFARIMLDLVKYFLGDCEYKKLKEMFKKHKVKYSKEHSNKGIHKSTPWLDGKRKYKEWKHPVFDTGNFVRKDEWTYNINKTIWKCKTCGETFNGKWEAEMHREYNGYKGEEK